MYVMRLRYSSHRFIAQDGRVRFWFLSWVGPGVSAMKRGRVGMQRGAARNAFEVRGVGAPVDLLGSPDPQKPGLQLASRVDAAHILKPLQVVAECTASAREELAPAVLKERLGSALGFPAAGIEL